jgi:hypothetical protein
MAGKPSCKTVGKGQLTEKSFWLLPIAAEGDPQLGFCHSPPAVGKLELSWFSFWEAFVLFFSSIISERCSGIYPTPILYLSNA